jgi:fatty acid/phospholipid biosynthesis enzyme
MSGQLTVALDAMGGDLGPDAVIPGAALALRSRGDTQIFDLWGRGKNFSSIGRLP